LAAIIRVRAAMNDLWMDEIWSIELIRELRSAIGVFTQTHHDNNHYLNSLFIYFLGQRGNWPGYRILSEVAGIGAVVLAWIIGARRDKSTAFFSAFLVSFSYVLILYSSEARGYASLVFFCFLCFLILRSFLDEPRWQLAILFSLSAVLGFTSHLTFLIFLLASLIWFGLRLFRSNLPLQKIVVWTAAFYAVPCLYLVALYWVDIRFLQIGGGTPISMFDGYRATLAWALGGPNASWWQTVTAGTTAVGVMAGLVVLFRDGFDEWVFFLGVAVVIPLCMPLFEHGTLHYVRYFIVAFAFILLLLAQVLARLYQSGSAGRITCAVFCSVFIVLNAQSVLALFKYGRGQLSEAVNFLVHNSIQQPASLGGQQDFRTQFMLGFYWHEMLPDNPANYYDHEHWPNDGPEWVIFHKESFTQPVPHGKRFSDKFGNWFELVRTIPTAPLSGVHLFLYRKIPKPDAP
jgi:Dolichyl-phosphate-mannose-protein mannosyltransferase